jgi:hypothetical protein
MCTSSFGGLGADVIHSNASDARKMSVGEGRDSNIEESHLPGLQDFDFLSRRFLR